jgi:hypothetical protein
MQEKAIIDIVEADINDLIASKTEEGLTLEFKQEIDLSQSKQKSEAAKDVSALANTAGGRILYGVVEAKLPDGSVVADSIKPITDGGIASRLADILYSTIHPRPRFNMHSIPVTGGKVLVLEVYPSFGIDLHMVTGYGENRFYRRGPKGVVPMTEPEIRDAYIHVAESRASLETRIDSLAKPELVLRALIDESIMVIPIYSRPDLLDPRQLRQLGPHLQNGVLKDQELRDYIDNFRLGYDGYRLVSNVAPSKMGFYLAVLKSGVTHFSFDRALIDQGAELHFPSVRAAHRILQALIIANEVLKQSKYWGPVRILYQLRPQKPWRIEPDHFRRAIQIIPGTYNSQIDEISLQQSIGLWDSIVKALLDPIFHAAGDFECPHFSSDGVLNKEWSRDFARYKKYIRIET